MEQSLRYLKEYFGYDRFRPNQEPVVQAILAHRDVLAVMPTGAGKSVCYQVPALCLGGITLVISPLISLMQDQVMALIQSGIRAAWLNSSLTPRQQALALERAEQGAYQIIYVAPERLSLPAFRRFAQRAPISMVTIDEAHCISQWGHDFRPSYLNIADFLASLPRRPIVAAFTATATQAVREDIIRSLQLQQPETFVSGFDRPNLYFEVQEPKDRDGAILNVLHRFPNRSGIIYCLSRKQVDSLTELLRQNGYAATRYHAGLEAQERQENQEEFLYDRARIMVATNAFGMGIDKSNVSFVIHCGMPGNPESYYQEAGRAGRDGSPAQCILFFQRRDIVLNRYFIESKEEDDSDPDRTEALRKHDLNRLGRMIHYCEAPGCLRKSLLEYFGETAPAHCGNCSNCLSGQAPEDVTALGRSFVLCVALLARKGKQATATAVIAVLHGTEDPQYDWLEPRSLSCYGELSNQSPARLRRVANALLDQGFLTQPEANRAILVLTEKAPSLVSGKTSLLIKPAPAKAKKQITVRTDTADEALFALLKKTRTSLARQAGLPPFMVLSDAVLREMAALQPRTPEEFRAIKGIGERKAKRYDKAFLGAIQDWKSQQ